MICVLNNCNILQKLCVLVPSVRQRKNLLCHNKAFQILSKNLESEVEFPLLTRNKRGVSLTKNGEVFYEKVVAFLNSYDDVLTCATELKRDYLRNNNKIILTVNPLFLKFLSNIFFSLTLL